MIPNQTNITAGYDQGLSLLSLDGGGVRGLSSLYILDQIMHSVNTKAKNDPPLNPCEYFDMIGGTNTGGYIAAKNKAAPIAR
ncbi:MAG: hypothetical protein LQ349_004914 [Xanthoria aureola]|nr:MAG: hypothetical protein LQ349_004914 [Xanthoria aureola]